MMYTKLHYPLSNTLAWIHNVRLNFVKMDNLDILKIKFVLVGNFYSHKVFTEMISIKRSSFQQHFVVFGNIAQSGNNLIVR